MNLTQAQFLARVGDPRLGVSLLGSRLGGVPIGEVVVRVLFAPSRAGSDAETLDGDVVMGVIGCEPLHILGAAHDRCARPIADSAAVEEPQWPGNNGGVHRLLHGDLPAQVSSGIPSAIVMALHGYLGQSPLAFFLAQAPFAEVSSGCQRVTPRRGTKLGSIHGIDHSRRACSSHTAEPDVLQLLEAQRQDQIILLRCQTVGSTTDALRSGGAAILHAGDGNLLQLQCLGDDHSRGGRFVLIVSRPACIDLLLVYARVSKRFVAGFGDEIEDAAVPSLTPLG